MNNSNFSSTPLSHEMLANIESLGFQSMTPIQAQSLPVILTGNDLLAQAKTGSGKTAAFAIGLLHKLDVLCYQTQAMIICPTRELADQVSKEIRRLASHIPNTKIVTLCGGKPLSPQLNSLQRAPHIVVGTPGRLLKHLEKGSLDTRELKTLILDEADRMLDMGFHDDIMRIIERLPSQRQTLLFSATYPAEIRKISNTIQINPKEVRIEATHDHQIIKQIFCEIKSGERTSALVSVLQHYQPESCVVFCNRKQQCQELADELWQQGFHAIALHGNHDQKKRDQVLIQFSNKSSSILVATDVAARGLDIKDLQIVINFELSSDPENYIHRIGRTGRAGNQGMALSLFTSAEKPKLETIEQYQNSPVIINNISSFKAQSNHKILPSMVTLCISGGRKNKVRAGDILGALTANSTLSGNQVGKIDIAETLSYVAVQHDVAKHALQILSDGKIKGRQFKVRILR